MKKSTKRFCLKLAASILSTTLVASIALPMNVLATTIDTTEILSENATINSSSNDYSDNIIREVEEERDEFSKTFLMTDGTYYTYVSPVAIHEFIEDKWVNIDDCLNETPSTISEAEEMVKAYIETANTNSDKINTFSLHDNVSPITVNCVGNASYTNSKYTLLSNGALVIKPSEITRFSMANQVLLSATLSVSISESQRNNSRPLYLKHITSEDDSSTYAAINTCKNIYYKLYDKTKSEYSFDITDIYSKWERDIVDNNGVALVGSGIKGNGFEITSVILSISYKDVSANDSSFTYHTLDLGRAGVLSINDVTNAYKLEQTIAGLDCSLLPVTLTKTIDSAKFSLNSYANVSSEWNYNYGLSVAGPYATLILPQGTIIDFKQPENVETIDQYQVWEQDTNRDYVDGATFHITESALNSTTVGDIYQDCYVDINGIEYWFNSVGRIEYIKKADKELKVEYSYFSNTDQLVISKLTDAVGNQYLISYSAYTVNDTDYIYANKIEVKDSENQYILFDNTPLVIDVLNTVTDNTITSTFTYPSENDIPIRVAYTYDLNGKLLYIQGTDGTITELYYKSEDNSYLTGYTQKKNNEVLNTFTITSDNTFERVFEGTLIQKETQRYNADFQLITYYYGNNVMGVNYEGNSIDSYALKKSDYSEIHNLLDNGCFDSPLDECLWEEFLTGMPDYDADNQRVIIENDNAGTTLGIRQTIEEDPEIPGSQNLKADTTYVFSAEIIVADSIPSDDYALKATIELFVPGTDISLGAFELPFDVSLLEEEQIRLCSFKSDIECAATVSIYAEGQLGEIYLDNVYVYEAVPEDGSATMPGVSLSDPITTTITEDGTVIKEYISDGSTYMLQEYKYSSNGQNLINTTDFNDASTFFDYSGRSTLLSEKGSALDGNYISNPIEFEYNRAGLLKKVSQTINSVTGENLDLLTNYTYDSSDRITTVSNNNYSYNFTYDDIGNLTNINKNELSSEMPQTNNLVDYTYVNNNIGSIVYSNGYKLEYSYNENGEITNITGYKLDENNDYTVVGSYMYTYSDGHISETIISSVDLSHDIKIKCTDSKIEIYYLQNDIGTLVYSKEQEDINTVETFISSVSGVNEYETISKTPITETTIGTTTELYSEFYSEKLSIVDSESIVATNGSNNVVTDYFGRISSKYFTLETNLLGSTDSDSIVFGLTNNYTYKTLEPDESIPGNRTSNLIESITNELTIGNTTTNDFTYNYAYDSHGNIRFVYRFYHDGSCYMESYYQYDEANQVTATLSPLGCEFYVYDDNGNIIEKILSEDVAISGIDATLIGILENVTYETWNTIDWSAFNNMRITPVEPESIQYFTYDSLGQMIKYEEKSFSYDSEGNLANTTVENSFEIPYDSYGNPLKYIGKNTVNETIVADLSWNGNQLTSAIIYSGSTPEQKLTFAYDENGFRINKTVHEYAPESNTDPDPFVEQQQINYVWENGQLSNMQLVLLDEGSEEYMYTNILYDNLGSPCGIISPTGIPYYFLKDSSDNVCGLVNVEGEIIVEFIYDAFGSLYMDVKGNTTLEEVFNTIEVMYNPCTYKGYLYDYELGTYFIQNKCYSPTWGRTLNETSLEELTSPTDEPLKINSHIICNNNLINNHDANAEWDRNKFTFTSDQSRGIQVDMDKAFLSRPFCTLYASKIISESGTWDYLNGRNIKNMSVERIASNLFARCVGNYAESAINRVNATWGDGWIVSNRNSEIISITETDTNADKYLKIWLAAPSIKSFATANGIYITL